MTYRRFRRSAPIASASDLGFLSALFLLFLGLKLGGAIDWSWWWVTCPVWCVPAIVVVVLALGYVVGLAARAAFVRKGVR